MSDQLPTHEMLCSNQSPLIETPLTGHPYPSFVVIHEVNPMNTQRWI